MDIHRTSSDIKMRCASIDIGTNTILMLIADVGQDGVISVVRDEHFIARLGKGVDEHGIIQKDTFERVRGILIQLKTIAVSNKVQNIFTCGTSALRDAANRHEFIDYIKNEVGFEIQILSGREEAEMTYLGAISGVARQSFGSKYAVLDIGGGSTELVVGIDDKVVSAVSMDIGSVRITERILKTSPPTAKAIDESIQFIGENLKKVPVFDSNTELIGVAGTLTTLAALDLKLPAFNSSLVQHHTLTTDAIESIFNELKALSLEQIKNYPQINHARADILLAGILILIETMKKVNKQNITTSVRGLRYGIMIKNVC
jgi:exopolyphosphatase/guanosine-5'-triphosphate,3'-diphosphate pyrophosphatase